MTGSRDPPPLLRLDRPDPTVPILVTGLSSAVVLCGDGTLRCSRETRGGLIDWGGVYSQGVRLTGPWHLRVSAGGPLTDLASSFRSLEAWRWAVRTRHLLAPGLEIEQTIVPFPESPAVGRKVRLRNAGSVELPVVVESEATPFLAPVLIEGLKPYEFEAEAGPDGLRCSSHGYVLRMASSPLPSSRSRDAAPWSGDRSVGELSSLVGRYELTLAPGATARLDQVAYGGVERALSMPSAFGRTALAAADAWEPAGRRAWGAWLASTPTMSFPSDPRLETAYDLARSAVRALYTHPDPEITGLVAGYPWYCALWGRDLAWMLPAVLWLGDVDWVRESLRTMFRYQATRAIPLLAAEAGELPMQVAPGPVFLFGTSDTTLYYPEVLRQFVAHTGQRDLVNELWPHLCEIVRWSDAKVDPSTQLFTNGGEVLALRDAAENLGAVHYGIDAPDTTIWDSADRRDHAVDLQVLRHVSRRALLDLATGVGRLGELPGSAVDAANVPDQVRTRYRWPEERYLYDSLGRDGTPSKKLRPNALRAVSAGLLEPADARALVGRAMEPDLTTDWGVRTLSDRDPTYDPQAYHEGQVWTIATAWAADAALAVGDVARGMTLLRTIATRIIGENGLANECYRGDRPEPFDSCFLLGFSVAPFLSVLFERLWGLGVDATKPLVRAQPQFPAGWTSASLKGLRVGAGAVDLAWAPGRLDVRWTGPGSLELAAGGHSGSVAAGSTVTMVLPP